jgi:NAD(P)-dependent dehydrogenase (short-subunit alcohol dehydrogenase family)
MKDFTDKVAAITGSASGIGRALALALARRKCHVALCDVNETGLAQTAEEARALGVRVTQARVDVADRAAVYAWAAQVAKDHGRVNLIFNNAGVAVASTVEGMDYADFEWIMGINFWGVVYGTKAFLPYLKASGDGHIVNISSVFGLCAQPTQSAYNASKFAVRGFTEALRQELDLQQAPVSATCVHPGGIKTNIVRTSRYSASMNGFLNDDEEQAKADFEKMFITTADEAARVILKAVEHNKRRVLIGRDARALDVVQRLLPSAYQRLLVSVLKKRKEKAAAARAMAG